MLLNSSKNPSGADVQTRTLHDAVWPPVMPSKAGIQPPPAKLRHSRFQIAPLERVKIAKVAQFHFFSR